jgi:hypothetical protein
LTQSWDARRFEVLMHQLLLRRLDEFPAPEAHARIIQEARAAQALACKTPFPMLVFPCLFEERARAASERHRQQERLFWQTATTVLA